MRGLFGGLLLAVGILLMTLSGLCSIAITISEIGQVAGRTFEAFG